MQEFIKKRPLRYDSPESSSSEETARSKPPKDVLGLGIHLVNELGLKNSTDTLGRWLAHHLAKLITEARNRKNSREARRETGRQATELILKIWERRTILPGNANPLARYKEILKAIDLLHPDANPWHRTHITRHQIIAGKIYDQLCRIVMGLLLIDLLPIRKRKFSKNKNPARFLSADEQAILKHLDHWSDLVKGTSHRVTSEVRSQSSNINEALRALVGDTIEQLRELQQLLAKTQ